MEENTRKKTKMNRGNLVLLLIQRVELVSDGKISKFHVGLNRGELGHRKSKKGRLASVC